MPPPRQIKRGFETRVNTERMTLPNATGIDVVPHPGASVAEPSLYDDRGLLIRRYRHAAHLRGLLG